MATWTDDRSRFVGRERELMTLRAALDDALAGRGSLVLIGGEAGIGKTALAEVLITEAAARGALVLVGRCYDLSETPPYGPWIEAFARAPDGASLPLLPLAVSSPEREGEALASQEAIFRRLGSYLAVLAARRPVVLLLEDLHWADPVSLDLLRVLARGFAAVPCLLLATYRTDEVPRDHPLGMLLPALVRESRAQRLDLRPLDTVAIGTLVTARYALSAADHVRLVGYLDGRTEGNALFLSELLRTLEGEGVLLENCGRWLLGDLERVPVPVLLRQVIEGRVSRLDADVRRLLGIAAVIGQQVSLMLWGMLGEVGQEHLLDLAEPALVARLLVEIPDGSGVRFAHALIRETLYAGMPALQRRILHRRTAEFLIASPLPEPDGVASHLGRAGDARELDWLIRAGERALVRHAPQAALDRLTRALDLAARQGVAPSVNLYRTRGLARETLGDFAGALVDQEAALAAARAVGDRHAEWRTQLDLGQLWASRDYARSFAHYDRALALARGLTDPAALVDSLNRLGNWLVNVGRAAEGVAHHREALALLEGLDDRRGMADTLDLLGMARWIGLGEAVPAVRDFGRASDLLRALDLPQLLSSCLASRCVAACPTFAETVGSARWPLAACLRDADEADRLAGMADWAAGRAYANLHAGLVLTGFGQWGRALDRFGQALELAAAIDHRQWLAGTRCCLGQLHVLLLDPVEASHHLGEALALARDLNSAWWTAGAATYLALAHLQAGDHGAAEAALAAVPAESFPAATSRTLSERRLAWAQAEVRLAQGRTEEALALVDDLLASAPGSGPIPALLIVRGLALLALGQPADAVRALDDAVRGAQARHERPALWRAHAARAGLFGAQGRPDEAGRAAEAARIVIADLAATLPGGEARDGFQRRAEALLIAWKAGTVPLPAPTPPDRGGPALLPGGLSRREAEVLRLLAIGRSNHQIAAALFLSPRTVQRHVANAYLKIGAHNKADATAYAVRHGLA